MKAWRMNVDLYCLVVGVVVVGTCCFEVQRNKPSLDCWRMATAAVVEIDGGLRGKKNFFKKKKFKI